MRIHHPALLHKLNTVYDKITHTLGYNLTVQKHMSGFKTHQTPAAKGIHVWIVFVLMTFMNVYYYALQPIDDAQLWGGAGAALLWSKFYLDVE